ncbi:MAG: hypothetical protein B0W54_01695 [Cellvibrio sp. 79]|nr:MAG: hypothetical protein B0W54_01695 [Cellvibrio sp. 79]
MLKRVLFLPAIVFPPKSFADSLTCGGSVIEVVDAPSAAAPYFQLMIKSDLINRNYKFEIQKDNLFVRCEETKQGVPILLINHFCGGSGCADFGNFGIIEVETGAILLEPDQPFDGNKEKAEEIMGRYIGEFTCSANNEICMHSKIELG